MLPAEAISATVPRVGRKRVNFDKMPARFPEGTFARIDASLAEGENRSDFLRIAVEAEVARRSTPPVQHPPSRPVAVDEPKPAERRSREPPKKAKAITLPAKPVKGVQPVEKPVSVDIQIGPTPVKAGARLKTAKGTKR